MSRARRRKVNRKAEEAAAERDELRQIEQHGVSTAHEKAEEIQKNLLEFVSDSDLSEGSKSLLRNYASKSFILGFLQEGEVNEIKWELRTYHELYLDLHPGSESLIQDDIRQWVNDDPKDDLTTLTPTQKIQVATFFQGIWMNVTRARGMKQQEILKTQIARSEVERGEENKSGGIIARLPGV